MKVETIFTISGNIWEIYGFLNLPWEVRVAIYRENANVRP